MEDNQRKVPESVAQAIIDQLHQEGPNPKGHYELRASEIQLDGWKIQKKDKDELAKFGIRIMNPKNVLTVRFTGETTAMEDNQTDAMDPLASAALAILSGGPVAKEKLEEVRNHLIDARSKAEALIEETEAKIRPLRRELERLEDSLRHIGEIKREQYPEERIKTKRLRR